MKTFKISLLCLLLCIMSAMSFAQTPEKMSYQAVFRNMYDRLITEQPVAVQISILQGGADGTVVFQEKQTVTPNADGIGTFEIGGGTAVVGTLKDINWAEGPYYLKAEMDPEGGEDFTVNGAVELVAVPYAFYAYASAGEFSGSYKDLTGTPEIPVVPEKISELENNSGFMSKEAQELVKTGNTLTLTGAANIIELPAFNVFESDPTKNVVNRPEGKKAGEMIYWDGETWKTVTPGVAGQVLVLDENSVPTWVRRPGTKTAPQVTLTAGEEYAYTASLVDDGGMDVTARGFKYATTAGVANNASATDVVIADGEDFTTVIPATGHNVTYYVVAYATNEKGTSYSDELSFTMPDFPRCGTVVDIEGNEYQTIIIGKQCWMAENLRVKTQPNGTKLGAWASAGSTALANICGEVLPEHTGPTGIGPEVFYNWRTAANSTANHQSDATIIQGICPDGWHLPNRTEFQQLAQFIDPDFPTAQFTSTAPVSNNQLAIKLANKDCHWDAYASSGNNSTGVGAPVAQVTNGYNVNSIGYAYHHPEMDWSWNETGFDAKPAGYLDRQSVDAPHGWVTNGTLNLWTAYGTTTGRSFCVKIACYNSGINQVNSASAEARNGYSVRCVSNEVFE